MGLQKICTAFYFLLARFLLAVKFESHASTEIYAVRLPDIPVNVKNYQRTDLALVDPLLKSPFLQRVTYAFGSESNLQLNFCNIPDIQTSLKTLKEFSVNTNGEQNLMNFIKISKRYIYTVSEEGLRIYEICPYFAGGPCEGLKAIGNALPLFPNKHEYSSLKVIHNPYLDLFLALDGNSLFIIQASSTNNISEIIKNFTIATTTISENETVLQIESFNKCYLLLTRIDNNDGVELPKMLKFFCLSDDFDNIERENTIDLQIHYQTKENLNISSFAVDKDILLVAERSLGLLVIRMIGKMSLFIQPNILKVPGIEDFRKLDNSLIFIKKITDEDNSGSGYFLDEYILNKENSWFLNRRQRLDLNDDAKNGSTPPSWEVELITDYMLIFIGQTLYTFRHSILTVFLDESDSLMRTIYLPEMKRLLSPIPLSDQIFDNYFYIMNKNGTISVISIVIESPTVNCQFESITKDVPNFDIDKNLILTLELFERNCPRKRLSNDSSVYSACSLQRNFALAFLVDDLQDSYLYVGMFLGLAGLLLLSVGVFIIYRKINKKYLKLGESPAQIQIRSAEEFQEQVDQVIPPVNNDNILNAINGLKDPNKDTPRFSVDEPRGGDNGMNQESIDDIYKNL